ncbi:4-aminobutyrate--2-oxoglutarate transaminase [Herbiconiux sp.]|uniref:4-aminobutyrate--2-oxoglutarate transaminase n=1 Tax=Herbiconiux sp. TaxID=1871186 RepID=UPI0025C7257F|nr:4-aminobutyrate--2-oxoglutarate transaminase [Herbiconiux sp.]
MSSASETLIAPSLSQSRLPQSRLPQSRLLRTELPGPVSQRLHAERREHVSSGFGIALPVFVERADGAVLEDVDGNRILDLASGIAVTSVGAANPLVQQEVAAQLARFTHTCFMVTEYDGFVKVCRWLNENTPGDFDKRTALFSTGAEAVENAVKIARAATGRPNVLVFDEAYHGRSLLTMAMTAKPAPYKNGFGPFPEHVVRAPNAVALRWPGDPERVAEEALAEVERLLAEHGADTFAALVIEPIQGEGGFLVPAPGFLAGLRELATRHGIVFVADEIQAGMGRTGRMFAIEHEGVVPDLVISAKALAGGLPLSAVTGRAEIMDAPSVGGLGGTYAGNPLACAAALGVFQAFEEEDLLGRAVAIEQTVRAALEPHTGPASVVAEVRGRGAMMAVEFAQPWTLEPLPELAKAVAADCLAQGVLVLVCGTHGNVVRLLPPLVIEDALLDDGLAVLTAAVAEAQQRFLGAHA